MIRPWFRQAAVPWTTTATQTRASGENRVSTKPGVLQADGELDCPGCGGVLGGWGRARPRRVRVADGPDAVVVPRRSRCRGCGATHVLLPAWCLSRRADEGAVIGAALRAAAAGGGR